MEGTVQSAFASTVSSYHNVLALLLPLPHFPICSNFRRASIMRIAFTIPAVLAALAYADSEVSTSVESSQTCFTKYRPANGKPSSLPTRTKCSSQTVSSVVTTCGTQSTVTTTVTPDAVTATANGTYAYDPILVTQPAKRAACSTTTTV